MHKILVAGLAALAAIVSVWSLSNLVSPKMFSKLEATEAATAPMAPHGIMVKQDRSLPAEYFPDPF